MRLATLLCIVSLASAQDSNRVFRAGAATANITPPLGTPIVGGWSPFPATYVHDELRARALVLDDGSRKLVIVVNDNLSIARYVFDAARRSIHEKTGIPVENMLMSATHTHSGPSARQNRDVTERPLDEYQRFLAARITDAVLCAVHNLEPARIGWGSGREPSQVFNRRWHMRPGTVLRNPFGGIDRVKMNPGRGDPNLLEPAGPTDPEIAFLSVQSKSGRPIALLANYSLHYVGGVGQGHISADYYGMFADRIAELFDVAKQDPPFVGMLSNGTSGDINNIDFRNADARKYAPYEKMRMVANMVAAEVFKACQTLEYRDWVPLAAAVREVPLPVRLPGPKDVEWAQAVLKNPPKVHIHEVNYANRTLAMKDYPASIPVLLQALRIGDVGIAAIPNEVFVEIGLEIKKSSPLPRTFTIELANGAYGYLPTPEQHKLGGYETWRGSGVFETDASRTITDTILELLGKLK